MIESVEDLTNVCTFQSHGGTDGLVKSISPKQLQYEEENLYQDYSQHIHSRLAFQELKTWNEGLLLYRLVVCYVTEGHNSNFCHPIFIYVSIKYCIQLLQHKKLKCNYHLFHSAQSRIGVVNA